MELGTKYDSGKVRFSLIPNKSLFRIVQVLEHGAIKYAPENWRYVEDLPTRYYDAMMRHVYAYRTGEYLDPESGFPHLAHAICCLMFILEVDEENGY